MEVVYELNLQNWNGERFRTLFSHEKWRIVARATSRLHVRSIEPLDLEISVIRARETSRFPLEENEEWKRGSEKEEEKFNFRSPRNLFKRGIYRLEYLAPRFFASPFQFIASGNDSPSDPSSTVFLFFFPISLPKESSRDRGFVVHAA